MPPLSGRVTIADLESASRRVGERRGWDFSRIRAIRDPAPWDYEALVSRSGPRHRVLDIGTGGGEVLRRMHERARWEHVVALDHSERMTAVASSNVGGRVEIVVGDAAALPTRTAWFDLVLDRHASVNPREVARVLEPGGTFITQQVGPRNTQSIFDAFGWGSNWDQFAQDDPPPRRCEEHRELLVVSRD